MAMRSAMVSSWLKSRPLSTTSTSSSSPRRIVSETRAKESMARSPRRVSFPSSGAPSDTPAGRSWAYSSTSRLTLSDNDLPSIPIDLLDADVMPDAGRRRDSAGPQSAKTTFKRSALIAAAAGGIERLQSPHHDVEGGSRLDVGAGPAPHRGQPFGRKVPRLPQGRRERRYVRDLEQPTVASGDDEGFAAAHAAGQRGESAGHEFEQGVGQPLDA